MDEQIRKATIDDDVDYIKQRVEERGKAILFRKDMDAISIMHLAAEHGAIKVLEYMFSNTKDTDFLFAADEENRRPLHWACWKGQEQVVDLLLQYNCRQQEQSTSGFTALHYAIFPTEEETAIRIIQALLKAGLNVEKTDNNRETCIDVARRFNKHRIIKVLEQLPRHSKSIAPARPVMRQTRVSVKPEPVVSSKGAPSMVVIGSLLVFSLAAIAFAYKCGTQAQKTVRMSH